MLLWHKKSLYFHTPTNIESSVPFAFIMAVGGIGLEDVAVAAFQLFQDGAFIYGTGTNVIGESSKNIFVTSILLI